jgi:hypothetical protein
VDGRRIIARGQLQALDFPFARYGPGHGEGGIVAEAFRRGDFRVVIADAQTLCPGAEESVRSHPGGQPLEGLSYFAIRTNMPEQDHVERPDALHAGGRLWRIAGDEWRREEAPLRAIVAG